MLVYISHLQCGIDLFLSSDQVLVFWTLIHLLFGPKQKCGCHVLPNPSFLKIIWKYLFSLLILQQVIFKRVPSCNFYLAYLKMAYILQVLCDELFHKFIHRRERSQFAGRGWRLSLRHLRGGIIIKTLLGGARWWSWQWCKPW